MHEDRLLFWDKEKHDNSVKCASLVLNIEGDDVCGAIFCIIFCESRCRYLQKSKNPQTPTSSSALACRVLGTQKTNHLPRVFPD